MRQFRGSVNGETLDQPVISRRSCPHQLVIGSRSVLDLSVIGVDLPVIHPEIHF